MIEDLFDISNMRMMSQEFRVDAEKNYDAAAECLRQAYDILGKYLKSDEHAGFVYGKCIEVATHAAHVGRRHELAADITSALVDNYTALQGIKEFNAETYDRIERIRKEVDELYISYLSIVPVDHPVA